jgi:hypothetical protein
MVLSHLRSLNAHMDDIQSVMTPLQLAKFFLWIDSNEWVLQMLNSMFTSTQINSPIQTPFAGTGALNLQQAQGAATGAQSPHAAASNGGNHMSIGAPGAPPS